VQARALRTPPRVVVVVAGVRHRHDSQRRTRIVNASVGALRVQVHELPLGPAHSQGSVGVYGEATRDRFVVGDPGEQEVGDQEPAALPGGTTLQRSRRQGLFSRRPSPPAALTAPAKATDLPGAPGRIWPPRPDKRPAVDRLAVMEQVFLPRDAWVLSGSILGWGDSVVERCDAVVFLSLDPAERMRRIEAREHVWRSSLPSPFHNQRAIASPRAGRTDSVTTALGMRVSRTAVCPGAWAGGDDRCSANRSRRRAAR
jgi:hypothetical protein